MNTTDIAEAMVEKINEAILELDLNDALDVVEQILEEIAVVRSALMCDIDNQQIDEDA